jgi:hypothetical protein
VVARTAGDYGVNVCDGAVLDHVVGVVVVDGGRAVAGDQGDRVAHAQRGARYLSAADAYAFAAKGAVGDILGEFYDADGRVLPLPIHDRRIGIDLSDLREIKTVVGVAGGPGKIEGCAGRCEAAS